MCDGQLPRGAGEEEKCDQVSAETYHLSKARTLPYH